MAGDGMGMGGFGDDPGNCPVGWDAGRRHGPAWGWRVTLRSSENWNAAIPKPA